MLDKRDYYRLPWSMNDNPIAWIEVTDICNIHCEGCYRQHITYYEGKFINSCRMDEYRLFGGFVSVLEKEQEEAHVAP